MIAVSFAGYIPAVSVRLSAHEFDCPAASRGAGVNSVGVFDERQFGFVRRTPCDVFRQGDERCPFRRGNPSAGGAAQTHKRLAGLAVADTCPPRCAAPLSVMALQYPLNSGTA